MIYTLTFFFEGFISELNGEEKKKGTQECWFDWTKPKQVMVLFTSRYVYPNTFI